MGANDQATEDVPSVVVNKYGETEAAVTDPFQWPPGAFLLHILQHEKALLDRRFYSNEYWQASARLALLKKFGYNVPVRPLVADTTLDASDILHIQKRWNAVVHEQVLQRNSTISNEGNGDGDSPTKDDDLVEFLSSGCRSSNGRTLEWGFMHCPPGTQFQLHAHPNIELVYCVAGALHEIRMQGEPITNEFAPAKDDATKVLGPALTDVHRPWSFGTLRAGQWLVNEVGSIHQSFIATNNGSCQLLVLWGGSHADVRDPPATPNVQEAVDAMDHRLCDCSRADWTSISETFLPESEKSSKSKAFF